MADGIDPGDPEGVGNDRISRAPAPLGGDSALLREAHQIPADEEELREPGLLDDIELVRELPDDRRRNRVISPTHTGLAQFDEIAERRLTGGHREPRKSIALEAEVDGARGRDLDRRCHALDPGLSRRRIRPRERRVPRRHRQQLRPRFQVRFPVGPAEISERVERSTMGDGRQDVAEFAILGSSVMDVVRGDHRQPEVGGQSRSLRHEPVVVGEEVMRELEEEPARGHTLDTPRAPTAPEDQRISLGHGPRPRPIPHQQSPGDLAIPAARQRHDALGMFGEERLGEPRHPFGPGEIGMGNEPAETPIPAAIPCQQHEMRAPLPLPDPAQVLLHDRPMARQPGPLRPRPGRAPLDRCRRPHVGCRTCGPAASGRPTARDHDPGGVADGGVEEFDLQPDDRVEPGSLGGGGEAHHPVQAQMVRDRKAGQAEFDRSLDEVVDRRRSVKEREVGVTVQLRVGELSHGKVPASGGQMEPHDRTSVRICETPRITQQHERSRRLKAVGADPRSFRSLAAVMTKIVAMIAIVSLLILVLLPAALAAQAGGG